MHKWGFSNNLDIKLQIIFYHLSISTPKVTTRLTKEQTIIVYPQQPTKMDELPSCLSNSLYQFWGHIIINSEASLNQCVGVCDWFNILSASRILITRYPLMKPTLKWMRKNSTSYPLSSSKIFMSLFLVSV